VTIKTLLFALFLYVCLVWVGAFYLRSGPQIEDFGLLWTAVGLIGVLAIIIFSRIFGWWRLRRARAVVRPLAPPKPVQPVHEDDAALAVLITQANAALGKLPGSAAAGAIKSLSSFPLYLLIGPEGSGKTSTFLNSGVEPQLLAGEASGTASISSTRLCNIWLGRNAVFIELSGRAFSGDLGRWIALLRGLRGDKQVSGWRRFWQEPPRGLDLRGVIGFCDVKELIGASADPQRFERHCRNWQERLRAIAEVFGLEFPVYQVIAKCDAVPFFPDFFRRLPEPEASQILGSTLPFDRSAARAADVLAEAEARRLMDSFRPLYQAVAKRRLRQLAHEPDRSLRPAIYEFPRELKRIRSSLVQFLTDVFRPNPLQFGPVLRGYYLTGTRQVEAVPAAPSGNPDASVADLDASRVFRGDATRMFSAEDLGRSPAPAPAGRKATTRRWMFVSDLFHRVVLADSPPVAAAQGDPRLELYRRFIFAAACGLCLLMCVVFAVSWTGNRRLLSNVQSAGASPIQRRGNPATLADLRALEALRLQVERLRQGAGLSMRWGLYSGNRILDAARQAYFRRFQNLLLNDLNSRMVESLAAAPIGGNDDQYTPLYRALKTHLMISSGVCKADPSFVSRSLKDESRNRLAPDAGPEWQAIADRQIDFYASELEYGNPCHLTENGAACDRARQYLQKAKGVEGIYRAILANAEKTSAKPRRLGDIASNYAQVLNGPAEVSAAFTPEGWKFVEKASKERNVSALESCVSAGGSTASGDPRAIQQMFIREYIDRWRKYVAGFSAIRFNGAKDAARRLEILADHKSPLLALFAMTADQTNFAAAADPSAIEKVPILRDLMKKGEKAASKLQDIHPPPPDTLSTADIARSFQPVQWVVPPGSDPWVVDRNNGYVDALAQLGHSMQDIADGKNTDPASVLAANQAANQNVEKGFEAVRQIAKGFRTAEVQGLDVEVQRLLEEPIRYAKQWIPGEIDFGAPINGEGRGLCQSLKTTLLKFPFQSAAADDASLAELAAAFAPGTGAVWKFQMKSLGELTVKEGSTWKAKDSAKGVQPTPEMLMFLNRAQTIADAFYPGGAAQPHFSYTLRPNGSAKNSTLELEVDGQPQKWTTSLQKQFEWPAAPGVTPGAVARIRTDSLVFPFASRSGLWGVFRIMNDAEPRPLMTKIVEWKWVRGGNGRSEPIDPPVQLYIVEFPGGADIFNRAFFDGFRCPVNAVQKVTQ
jgi:type VI secretion system protein ImpL